MQSPEDLAREKIDKLLTDCGWIIQNRSTINLSASREVAIREGLLKDRDEVVVDGRLLIAERAMQRECSNKRTPPNALSNAA
jgi:type I site-specific restriction endonuclease